MKKAKKNTVPPRSVGRPRVNLEFYEARELIRNENISSVGQYKKWWALNTPAKIPKRPDRAYKNQWVSWNNFLGSNNPFPCVKRSFRGFIEARTFVQQQALDTKGEWWEYCKSGKKPEDIPARPDLIYGDDWFTWRDWLGADISAVKRNVEAADGVFFILNNSGRPNNVYQLGITLEGIETVKRAQLEQQFRIIGMFYCDISFGWQSIVEELGRHYLDAGRSDEYIIPNVHEFIFQIGDFVEKVHT